MQTEMLNKLLGDLATQEKKWRRHWSWMPSWGGPVVTDSALTTPETALLHSSQWTKIILHKYEKEKFLKTQNNTKSPLFRTLADLEESDGDLHILWDRPHHHSPVGVFDAGLPTVRLRTQKKINTMKFWLLVNYYHFIRWQWTFEDFRRLLRVHTTTSLSGCLWEKRGRGRLISTPKYSFMLFFHQPPRQQYRINTHIDTTTLTTLASHLYSHCNIHRIKHSFIYLLIHSVNKHTHAHFEWRQRTQV